LFQGLIRRSSGLDGVRVHQVALASATDAEILDFAALDGRITVSRDKATMLEIAAGRYNAANRCRGCY
jgi:predicted nuclease of predicted toxin-antitoxin system